MNSYIYIITNKSNSTIYIGVTSDLVKRVYEHKNKLVDGFTTRYNLDKLVYYEIYDDINEAINREKQLKTFKRKWKNELIERDNRDWADLYDNIL